MREKIKLLPIVVAILVSCSKEPEREIIRPVRVIEAGSAGRFVNRNFPGEVTTAQGVNIAFEVGGQIIDLPIAVGSEVSRGDTLAQLDPRDYQNQVNVATAEYQRILEQRDRMRSAAAIGAVSQQEVTNVESALRVASANLEIAVKALEDTVLRAPFSGVIPQVSVDRFQSVQPKEVIARLVNLSDLEVEISVPETLIRYTSLIKTVEVTFDAFPDETFQGEIKKIGTEASQNTKTYPVTIAITGKEALRAKILPGMSATVVGKEYAKDIPEGVFIPFSAIEAGDEGNTAFWYVDKDEMVVRKGEISNLRYTSDGVYVQEGIPQGAAVVTAGIHLLREGMKVSILEETP